jgi:hypothetical protein
MPKKVRSVFVLVFLVKRTGGGTGMMKTFCVSEDRVNQRNRYRTAVASAKISVSESGSETHWDNK